MRTVDVLKLFTIAAIAAASATVAAAQGPPAGDAGQTGAAQAAPAPSREAAIAQEQATKARNLEPYVPSKGERIFHRLDTLLVGGTLKWHPFLENAYSGGGFALGAGRAHYVSAYNYIDARASYSIANYKRAEVEFVAPRLFNRRGHLSVLGGWREATQVGFYGFGPDSAKDDRANYLFQRPYASADLTVFPARRVLMLGGGVELTQWKQMPGEGTFPSVDEVYTPSSLPGLGARPTYLHTQGTVAIDTRVSPGYARRGVYIGATLHDYADRDDRFGFRVAEYEAIEHLPILRETWVLSLRQRVQTVSDKDGQQAPFFLLPSVGGGSSLRGFSSWRFRDRNSLLLQAEWRVIVNRYLDLAFFYDTGKVEARRGDLDFDRLKYDYGIGVRFHGPFSTPLRVDVSRSRESSLAFTFASSASF